SREGRSVEGVLCVEHHGTAERVNNFGRIFCAKAHPQEVLRIDQVIAWLNNIESATTTLTIGHYGRECGKEFFGLTQFNRRVRVFGVVMTSANNRDRGAGDVHRVGVFWQQIDSLFDRWV